MAISHPAKPKARLIEYRAIAVCVVTVLDGEPEHHDVYLNDTEKQTGDRIMTCVSRAKSARLVLDV